MADLRTKRGDTFSYSVVHTDSNGDPQDLTGMTVRSQVRYEGELVDTLTYTATSAADGEFTMSASAAATEEWPVGTLLCDIEYTYTDGSRLSTDTFKIIVSEDVTQ